MKKELDPFLTGLPPATATAVKESTPLSKPRPAQTLLADVARATIAKDVGLIRLLTEKKSLSPGQIKIDDNEPMSLARILVRHFDSECADALLRAGMRLNTSDRYALFIDAVSSKNPYESMSWILNSLFNENPTSIDSRGIAWPLESAINGFTPSESDPELTKSLTRFLVDMPGNLPSTIADINSGRSGRPQQKDAFLATWSQAIPLALCQPDNALLLKAMNNPVFFDAFSNGLLTKPAFKGHLNVDRLFRFIEMLPATTLTTQKAWLNKLPAVMPAHSPVRRYLSAQDIKNINRDLPEIDLKMPNNQSSINVLVRKCPVNTLTEALVAGGSPLVPALAANPITAPAIASILTRSFDCMAGFLISSPPDRIVATLSQLRQSIAAWRSPSNTNMLQYAHVLSGRRSPLLADLAASIDPILLTEPNKNGVALRDLLTKNVQVKADKRALRNVVKTNPSPPSTPKVKKPKRLM